MSMSVLVEETIITHNYSEPIFGKKKWGKFCPYWSSFVQIGRISYF
jgi:hypothetical protein